MTPEKLKQLKAIRCDRGIKQEVLATALGVSIATYSQIENGNTRLTVDAANTISKVLGVSPLFF